jgi:lysophospholipase L1-like esterase
MTKCLVLVLGVAAAAFAQPPDIVQPASPVIIGCIGDSITQGVGASAQAPACAQLPKFLNKFGYVTSEFSSVNVGISGTTSADWATGSTLRTAMATMAAGKVNVVQIMLGTNDSKVAVATSQAAYSSNLQTIINTLKAAGFNRIILHQPIYISQNAGQWDVVSSNELLVQYGAAVTALAGADPVHVFDGDHLGYKWFQQNPGDSADGIHPNDNGHVSLGFLWALAYSDSFLRSGLRPIERRR